MTWQLGIRIAWWIYFIGKARAIEILPTLVHAVNLPQDSWVLCHVEWINWLRMDNKMFDISFSRTKISNLGTWVIVTSKKASNLRASDLVCWRRQMIVNENWSNIIFIDVCFYLLFINNWQPLNITEQIEETITIFLLSLRSRLS